jgi:hypothetical protein
MRLQRPWSWLALLATTAWAKVDKSEPEVKSIPVHYDAIRPI